MFEDEVYSIASFLCNKNPVHIYFDDVPKEFKLPSMFYPMPELIMSTNDTTSSYKNSYQVFINIFDDTTRKAMMKAQELAVEILNNGGKIPLIDKDGVSLNRNLKINKVSTSKVDKGISQLQIQWDSTYEFIVSDESKEKIKDVIIQFNN